MTAVAVVPAAGAGERFGGDKILTPIDGTPMLERAVRSLLDGGVDAVVVVLGGEGPDLRRLLPVLADRRVSVAVNPDPSRGMLSSIQTGLAGVTGDPILVLPADMPYVRSSTVAALLQSYDERAAIISPRCDGKRGHPVVIPGRYRDEILQMPPSATLHDVIRAHAGERVDLEVTDRGILRDVDIMADLRSKP